MRDEREYGRIVNMLGLDDFQRGSAAPGLLSGPIDSASEGA
jgi:hypothetical protein